MGRAADEANLRYYTKLLAEKEAEVLDIKLKVGKIRESLALRYQSEWKKFVEEENLPTDKLF